MAMVELDGPMSVKDSPTLERERMEVFLRRPGGALVLARMLMPEEVAVDLGPLGPLVLRPSCSAIEEAALPGLFATCEMFALEAIETGVLLVERSFCRHLADAVVGAPTSLLGRRLSRIERGVVGGLAAAALAKLGFPLGVGVVSEPGPGPMGDALCVRVFSRVHGSEGQVWLCANATALSRAWQTLRMPAAPPILRIALARTQLSKAEVMAACTGDWVVFDESPACQPSSAWSVEVGCGGKSILVRMESDGQVHVDDREASTCRMRRLSEAGVSSGKVEVSAEIARAPSSSSSASADPRGDGILLRVGESDWAEGSLAVRDDRQAVRITRILRKMPAG